MFHKKILDVVHDREHGSSELLSMVLSAIDQYGHKLTPIDVKWMFEQLEEMDKSMVVMQHFVNHCRLLEGRDFLQNFEHYKSEWYGVQQVLTNQFNELFFLSGKSILTHSRSSSVFNVLKSYNRIAQIYQTESYPGGEGVLQADQLSKVGAKVTMIKDDEVDNILSQVDLCLFGCDQFSQDGFVNKVGTKEIASVASNYNVPIVVLSDTRKERGQLSNIGVLFEKIPLTTNITLLTERGVHALIRGV